MTDEHSEGTLYDGCNAVAVGPTFKLDTHLPYVWCTVLNVHNVYILTLKENIILDQGS